MTMEMLFRVCKEVSQKMLNAFINAYTWLKGCTVKEAKIEFTRCTKQYAQSVIQLYRDACRGLFYED